MKNDQLVVSHFEELIGEGDRVLASKIVTGFMGGGVDSSISNKWAVSCLSFIGLVIGKNSEYYLWFSETAKEVDSFPSAEKCHAILKAAYENYKGGFLFDLSKRIQAETFDDFLEQAEYLLSDGFIGVAIVTAGAVLEDTLRKMCEANRISITDKPKLNRMNDDLAKAGAYNALTQNKIKWLAGLRNDAAHGKWDDLKKEDAEDMIKATRRFVEDYAA